MRIAADVLGAGTVKVTGLPLGTRLYLALVAKNAEGGESEPTEQKTCDTAGPCGLEKIVMVADGWKVHVTGTLAPRGVGDAVLSIEYGAASGAYTGSVALGTVPAGAAADFSFDAQMPRIAAAYCRVKAVNAQSGQEWTTTSEEVARGFGGDIPDLWTAQNAPVGCKWLAGYYGGGSDTSTFDFDNGRLMNVTGVRFMLSSHGSALDRMTGFTVQGSVDGKTFTPIFHNAGRPLYQGAGLWMSLPLDEGCAGEYRYFRVSTKNGRGNNDNVTVVLVRMLTQDLVVDGERPRFWTDDSLGGTDVVPGVTFKGRLSSAPAGSADVYVAYAKSDLGDTFAAWRARGHVVRVGTVAEGESFSLAKDDIKPGDWVCRYFAVSGASEFTPLYAFGFSVGTRAFFPSKAYILNSAYGSGNFTLMKAYDGSATTRPDLSNGEKDFVFTLDEIPEGWRLASVRIWGAGVRDRMIGTPVSVSFDAVDLETDSVVLATANNRTVKGVTAFPDGQTWTQAGVFSDYAAVLDYWRSGEQLTEITLSEKLCRRHPKFLKVNKGSVYTGFCTAEIELRLVREPGLAIIVR